MFGVAVRWFRVGRVYGGVGEERLHGLHNTFIHNNLLLVGQSVECPRYLARGDQRCSPLSLGLEPFGLGLGCAFCLEEGGGFCGGTIVASRYVISAAHCFINVDFFGIVTRILTADDIHLWIGDHNIITAGETILQEIRIRLDSRNIDLKI